MTPDAALAGQVTAVPDAAMAQASPADAARMVRVRRVAARTPACITIWKWKLKQLTLVEADDDPDFDPNLRCIDPVDLRRSFAGLTRCAREVREEDSRDSKRATRGRNLDVSRCYELDVAAGFTTFNG
jgi:hypothetical protein